jgi:hypothetical protein
MSTHNYILQLAISFLNTTSNPQVSGSKLLKLKEGGQAGTNQIFKGAHLYGNKGII